MPLKRTIEASSPFSRKRPSLALVATARNWLATCPSCSLLWSPLQSAGVHRQAASVAPSRAKLPMGFIPLGDHRHFVLPYFDNTMWLDSGLREWVRDGDVIVAVGAKSGTTWMCYCADAIRRKGIKDGNGLLPYRDIIHTTPWLEASQKPGETWAERARHFTSRMFSRTGRGSRTTGTTRPIRSGSSRATARIASLPAIRMNVLPVLTYPKVKYVTMVRNGRDMARSWYSSSIGMGPISARMGSFPPAYPSIDAAMGDLMPGGNVYGLYFPYVHGGWLKEELNALLMHYGCRPKAAQRP